MAYDEAPEQGAAPEGEASPGVILAFSPLADRDDCASLQFRAKGIDGEPELPATKAASTMKSSPSRAILSSRILQALSRKLVLDRAHKPLNQTHFYEQLKRKRHFVRRIVPWRSDVRLSLSLSAMPSRGLFLAL